MKNQIFSACFLVLFLMSNRILHSQPNEATIFELTDVNSNVIATEAYQLLQDKAEYPAFPSQAQLKIFFDQAFSSPHVIYDPTACLKPGLRVFENAQSEICLRFDNLANSVNGNLAVGRLDYSTSTFTTSIVTYGNVLNSGINLPGKDLHCQIFFIGYLCPPANTNGPQVVNKFEILIVDKIIL